MLENLPFSDLLGRLLTAKAKKQQNGGGLRKGRAAKSSYRVHLDSGGKLL